MIIISQIALSMNEMLTRERRLLAEMEEWKSPTLEEMGISIKPDDDIFTYFSALVRGRDGTTYENGTFQIGIYVPSTYPKDAPRLRFLTKIWHPNVAISNGQAVFIDKMRTEWSESMNILRLLIALRSEIDTADTSKPLNQPANEQYLGNRLQFELTAKFWCIKYAKSDDEYNPKMLESFKQLCELGIDEDRALLELSQNDWKLLTAAGLIFE